jgi:hypothetical protein
VSSLTAFTTILSTITNAFKCFRKFRRPSLIRLSAWNTSVPIGRNFIKFYILGFVFKIYRKNLSLVYGNNNCYFTLKRTCICGGTSLSSSHNLFFWGEKVVEKIKANILWPTIFLKIMPFTMLCGKIWYDRRGRR